LNLILDWNAVALDAIRALGRLPGYSPDRARGGPPQVARSIGVIYTAVYDAWAAFDDIAKPAYSTVPRRPAAQRTEANRRKARAQAAYRALIDQFPPAIFQPDVRAVLEARMAALLAAEGIAVGDMNTNLANPVGAANVATDAVLAFRHADLANQAGIYAEPPAATRRRTSRCSRCGRPRWTPSTTPRSGNRCPT